MLDCGVENRFNLGREREALICRPGEDAGEGVEGNWGTGREADVRGSGGELGREREAYVSGGRLQIR